MKRNNFRPETNKNESQKIRPHVVVFIKVFVFVSGRENGEKKFVGEENENKYCAPTLNDMKNINKKMMSLLKMKRFFRKSQIIYQISLHGGWLLGDVRECCLEILQV